MKNNFNITPSIFPVSRTQREEEIGRWMKNLCETVFEHDDQIRVINGKKNVTEIMSQTNLVELAINGITMPQRDTEEEPKIAPDLFSILPAGGEVRCLSVSIAAPAEEMGRLLHESTLPMPTATWLETIADSEVSVHTLIWRLTEPIVVDVPVFDTFQEHLYCLFPNKLVDITRSQKWRRAGFLFVPGRQAIGNQPSALLSEFDVNRKVPLDEIASICCQDISTVIKKSD